MRETIRPLLALLAGSALLLAGNGLLGSLVAVVLARDGTPTALIGLVQTCYFSGFVIGALGGERVIRDVGHVRAFAAFAAVLAAAMAGHALWQAAMWWALLRLVGGTCMAGLFLVIESWMNGSATDQERGRVLGAYMITAYAAAGAGQILLQVPDTGQTRFLVAIALTCAAVVPVALTPTVAPDLSHTQPLTLAAMWRHAPLGLAGGAVTGGVIGAVYGMAPVYAADVGFGDAGVSWFMTALLFGALVLQWPIGWLSDRYDRRTVLVATAAALAVAALLVALAGRGADGVACAAVFGGLAFSLYPVCLANVCDRLPRDRLLPASATLLIVYSLGAAAGPLVAATVMQLAGPAALLVYAAALAGGLAAFGTARIRTVPAAPDQGPFAPAPEATPIGTHLDPRGPSGRHQP